MAPGDRTRCFSSVFQNVKSPFSGRTSDLGSTRCCVYRYAFDYHPARGAGSQPACGAGSQPARGAGSQPARGAGSQPARGAGPPARGAPLEPSLEPSITTTGARGTREPWLDRCLEAVNSHAVDAAALASNHELLAIWKREGYDLDADVIPLLVARTEVPRPVEQRITSWAYFRDALRSAKTKRLRQAETARIAENGKTAPAVVPPDPGAVLRQLADWINSGQPVPSSAVSNVKRDALIGLKLVTRERLRELGVY